MKLRGAGKMIIHNVECTKVVQWWEVELQKVKAEI
jgi:hypothetical protein